MTRLTWFLAWLAASLCWAPHAAVAGGALASAHNEGPAILMLTINDPSRPWVPIITEAFLDAVNANPEPPTVYLEYLDTARFGEPEYVDDFRAWLRRKYRDRRIDLVVARGQEVVEFLAQAQAHGDPWTGVPVLWGELGGLTIDISTSLPGAIGVVLESHVQYALQAIKTIVPDTQRLALVYGGSAVERARYAGFAPLVRRSGLELEPIDLGGLAMDDLVDRVSHLPERTVALFLNIQVDGAGRSFAHRRPCELISRAANQPLFALYAHDFGCGVVGGVMVDFSKGGRVLGEQAVKHLKGELTSTVTIPASRHAALSFDARQLERWGISERQLPAGSNVQFRPRSLWGDYGPQAMVAVVLGIIQTGLIVGLLIEWRRRHVAERDARRYLATAAHLDRRAVAGELAASLTHELNQPLGAIIHNAEAAELMLEAGSLQPQDLRAILADIRKDDARAAQIIRRMRDLLQKRELSLRSLDLNEVAADTLEMIALEAGGHGATIHLQLARDLPTTAGDRVHLQQVLLNVLLNSLHAVSLQPESRRRILLRTSHRDGYIEVAVTDSGPGISAEHLPKIFEPFFTMKPDGLGVGLSIARTIVEAHGGHIRAENGATGGATVRFSVPIKRVPPA